MTIELRNITVNLALSQETTLFRAEIYINGIKAGIANNDGTGGATCYHAYEGMHDLIRSAENHCASLPDKVIDISGESLTIKMDLEHFIEDLVESHISADAEKKLLKKIAKATETKIVWGNKSKSAHYEQGWIGKDITIARLLSTEKGTAAIVKMLRSIKLTMKEGETIWNENIPQEIMDSAFGHITK